MTSTKYTSPVAVACGLKPFGYVVNVEDTGRRAVSFDVAGRRGDNYSTEGVFAPWAIDAIAGWFYLTAPELCSPKAMLEHWGGHLHLSGLKKESRPHAVTAMNHMLTSAISVVPRALNDVLLAQVAEGVVRRGNYVQFPSERIGAAAATLDRLKGVQASGARPPQALRLWATAFEKSTGTTVVRTVPVHLQR